MTDESIRDKIAKLMRLATDSGAADNEAETAMRQAQKLMRKHNIDLAEVLVRTSTKPVFNWGEVSVPVSYPKPVKAAPLWFGWVITAIGRFTDTKVLYHWGSDHGLCAKFQGEVTDVEYAGWLCRHIRDVIRNSATVFIAPGFTSDDRWANREEFRHQMASRISDRLKALRDENEQAYRSSGTALMVVNTKIAERDERFGGQTYSRRKKSFIRGGAEAARAGRVAGDSVSLHRPLDQQHRLSN